MNMNRKITLFGLAMIPAGAALSAIGLLPVGVPLLFIGAILFSSFIATGEFIDYVTEENGKYVATVRQRHYLSPLIFFGLIRIIYKVSYFRVELQLDSKATERIELSREAYRQLLAQQCQQYQTHQVSKAVVEAYCNERDLPFHRMQTRFRICLVCLLLCATTVIEIWLLALIYCVPLSILLFLQYKDLAKAKIKKAAYDRYFPQSVPGNKPR